MLRIVLCVELYHNWAELIQFFEKKSSADLSLDSFFIFLFLFVDLMICYLIVNS